MEHARGHQAGQPSAVGKDTFTGRALLDPVLAEPGIRVNSVFFEPGARTYWHSHEGGQLLTATAGRGVVENQAGQRVTLQPGDVVWAPPGEVHWHGAAPGSFLAHAAVSLGQTSWAQEVPEEHYKTVAEG
jgi:quercetin dioxygenase-like cupin family protein